MSAVTNSFENVKAVILSCHKDSSSREKVNFYNSWAENYDQDVAVLDYRAPSLAAKNISSHFVGDREAAVVLDVACGTGLVAKQDGCVAAGGRGYVQINQLFYFTNIETFYTDARAKVVLPAAACGGTWQPYIAYVPQYELKSYGFAHFVGIDGSEAMLELARESGFYQDLKQCLLGEDHLPVQCGLFDVVVIVGALSVGQVPVDVVKELCKCTKPGGYVCMTTRGNRDNVEYKAALECELKQMEEEGLWTCVEVAEVEDWERAVSEQEDGYISGAVYIYKKLQL